MNVKRSDGQTVVEFTFMLPFILLLIMALAEFGFAFYASITVNNAASEAARFASVGHAPGCDGDGEGKIGWRAQQTSGGRVHCDEVSVQYGYDGERLDPVVVDIEHEHALVTPLPRLVRFVTGNQVFDDVDSEGRTILRMRACSDARLETDVDHVEGVTPTGSNVGCSS